MADFVLKPHYVFTKTSEYKTLVSNFENGVEQRRAKWATPLKTWKLQWRNIEATDVSTIQTLFDAKLGSYSSFTWTNPVDSVDYTVRFKDDSLKIDLTTYNRYAVELELILVK
jgi:phage-related protein